MAVLATAVWRVRPSGNNLNGGGYDPGISGAATDYSQQNAAQAIGTNGATSGAGSTTFTDATAGAFTAAMIGNCIQIASGTNFQAGFYFVTAFTNANSVVLDRTPSSGGAGSAGVWKLGGGWADPFTNTLSSGPIVPGNTCFILGSGTPNPSSYTYDYTTAGQPALVPGTSAGAKVNYANDPATPGYRAPPDTTGGMPVLQGQGIMIHSPADVKIQGLWFVASGTTFGSSGVVNTAGSIVFGCVLDQFSFDVAGFSGQGSWIGCEVFSSVAPGAGGANYGILVNLTYSSEVIGCNVHDAVGGGVNFVGGMPTISGCIIAKCRGVGLLQNGGNTSSIQISCINNNTIDGNTGNGIEISTTSVLSGLSIKNNIISNHTGVSKTGLIVDAGSTASNNTIAMFVDYNVFYNNTANYNAISAGAHDTALGSNPYVGQSTENYTLA